MTPACSPPLFACALSVALTGCLGSSRPARFYTLAPLQVRDDGAASTARDASLAIGPVEIPDSLDRQQIVTRTGANELVVAEFDRWGSSLDNQITTSLVATLGDRLASQQIAVAPWRSALLSGGTTYRAAVSISRFDGIPGQSVVLQGRWELTAQNGRQQGSLGLREATVTEKIDGAGYEALVAAMQRALVRFGQQMADTVAAATQMAKAP